MDTDSENWNPIETAPLDGTYLHLRGCYYSTASVVEVIGFYDMGGHTEGWCDERGHWFTPTEWKVMNVPLATIEERYQDLLNHLGVQGHDGAIAEIKALREQKGLDHSVTPIVSKEELIKILFANNINVKSPIVGINEENLILFALPHGWVWKQDEVTKEYFAYLDSEDTTEDTVRNSDVVEYLNSLQKSYDELNSKFPPDFPKSKLVAEPTVFETLVNCFKNNNEDIPVLEIIPNTIYKTGIQHLPPIFLLNYSITDLISAINRFNSANLPQPCNKEEAQSFFQLHNDINKLTGNIINDIENLVEILNNTTDKG